MIRTSSSTCLRNRHWSRRSHCNRPISFLTKCKSGQPWGFTSSTLAAARNENGLTWIVEPRNDRLCLIAIGPRGEPLSVEVLPDTVRWDLLFHTFSHRLLHAREKRVYLGLGNQVMILGQEEPMELRGTIHSLVGSAPYTRPRLAATFEDGGEVFWDDFEKTAVHPFASGMTNPIACFNRAGYLIAASEGACEVYSTKHRRVRLVADTQMSGPCPIAVIWGPKSDQFGLVCPDGEIRVYEICE